MYTLTTLVTLLFTITQCKAELKGGVWEDGSFPSGSSSSRLSDTARRDNLGDSAMEYLKQGLSEGEMVLKHAAGLGQTPNIIPVGQPRTDCEARPLLVGWHPVGGFAGKWFAQNTGLGKMITEKINQYPDPTQHWAVLVGDYVHQLWMDENFHVIYTNDKIDHTKPDEWRTFEVGTTHFNDDALRRTGEAVIESVRAKQAAYNLITNNCQTYALLLLDAVKATGESEFPTTLDVYERLTGPGKVMDLYPVNPEAESAGEAVAAAQAVMDENTTQLDTHALDTDGDGIPDELEEDVEDGKPAKKPGMFRRMFGASKTGTV